MTVSTTHVDNEFTGDGVTTVFNFTFQVRSLSQLKVSLAGVDQSIGFTPVLNSDQEQAPGGSVTFAVAPANGVAVRAYRSTPFTQAAKFTREAKIDTPALEAAFDLLVMMMQEAKEGSTGATGPQGPAGPAGAPGDIVGPATATDKAIAIWDGTTGALLKDGPAPANNGDYLQVSGGQWVAGPLSTTPFPSGSMMPWDTDMAAVPAGWEPMDGRTVTINGVSKVTKDTRGKYLLCAAENDTGSSGYTGSTVRPGAISGTKTHQHTNAGAVTIGNTVVSGSVATSGFGVQGGASGIGAINSTYPISTTAHNHTASLSGSTAASAESSRPIHVSFLMIIKVD